MKFEAVTARGIRRVSCHNRAQALMSLTYQTSSGEPPPFHRPTYFYFSPVPSALSSKSTSSTSQPQSFDYSPLQIATQTKCSSPPSPLRSSSQQSHQQRKRSADKTDPSARPNTPSSHAARPRRRNSPTRIVRSVSSNVHCHTLRTFADERIRQRVGKEE